MGKNREDFMLTVNEVARAVPCDPDTVRNYANLGLIACRRLDNGVRLFQPSAAPAVTKLRAEALLRRGGRKIARPTL